MSPRWIFNTAAPDTLPAGILLAGTLPAGTLPVDTLPVDTLPDIPHILAAEDHNGMILAADNLHFHPSAGHSHTRHICPQRVHKPDVVPPLECLLSFSARIRRMRSCHESLPIYLLLQQQ